MPTHTFLEKEYFSKRKCTKHRSVYRAMEIDDMGEVTQMKIRTLVLAYKQPQPVTGNTIHLIIVFTSLKYGQLDLFEMHSFMYVYAG